MLKLGVSLTLFNRISKRNSVDQFIQLSQKRNLKKYTEVNCLKMTIEENHIDIERASTLLDKLILRQLYLMEDKLNNELLIEQRIQNGSINLAKSRYIMGQTSVSKERLPTESSAEFAASITLDTVEEDNVKQLKLTNNNTNINPLNWFGVLVPSNLHKAKDIFKNAINYVVDCANIQIQILDNNDNIEIIKKYKKNLATAS